MKRGFVFSFSTILIFSFLVFFAAFYLQKIQRDETSIFQSSAVEKAGFAAEDIASDINTLLGTSVAVNHGQSAESISFFDRFPPTTDKLQLIDFKFFAENQYARVQKASINLGIEKLVDGKTEMVFSNNLRYDYDYSGDQNSVYFFRPGGNTQVTQYNVNIFVKGAEYDSPLLRLCPFGGSVTIRIFLKDSFGNTENINCTQDPNTATNYVFNFLGETGNLVVSTGNVDANPNSLRVRNTVDNPDVAISFSINAIMPSPGTEIVWYYDADLNYLQADVNVNRKIELGRA